MTQDHMSINESNVHWNACNPRTEARWPMESPCTFIYKAYVISPPLFLIIYLPIIQQLLNKPTFKQLLRVSQRMAPIYATIFLLTLTRLCRNIKDDEISLKPHNIPLRNLLTAKLKNFVVKQLTKAATFSAKSRKWQHCYCAVCGTKLFSTGKSGQARHAPTRTTMHSGRSS